VTNTSFYPKPAASGREWGENGWFIPWPAHFVYSSPTHKESKMCSVTNFKQCDLMGDQSQHRQTCQELEQVVESQ
jgi:hypothetical protein